LEKKVKRKVKKRKSKKVKNNLKVKKYILNISMDYSNNLNNIKYPKDYFKILHEHKTEINNLENEKNILLQKKTDISEKIKNINETINIKIKLKNSFVSKKQTQYITDMMKSSDVLTILTPDELSEDTRCSSCLELKKYSNVYLNTYINKNWVMSGDGVFCPKCIYHIQPKDVCIGLHAKEICKNPSQFKIKIANCFLCKRDKIITKCIHMEKILLGLHKSNNNEKNKNKLINIYNTILESNLFFCTNCIPTKQTIEHLTNHFINNSRKGIYFNNYNVSARIFSCSGNAIYSLKKPEIFKYDVNCCLCRDGFYKNKHVIYDFFENNINLPKVLNKIIFSYFDKIDYVMFKLL
jgi:hypothetical protein